MNTKHFPIIGQLLCLSIALETLTGCGRQSGQSSTPQTVHLASWGGQFQQDLLDSWIEPAAKSANITVDAGSWNGEYGALSIRIKKDINEWDLVHVEDLYISSPDASSLFETFPNRKLPSIVDPSLRANVARAVPILQYAYVLAYHKDAEGLSAYLNRKKKDKPDWGDYWDVAHIPGRRGLRDFPIGNIEIALTSMGIDIQEQLYKPSLTRPELENTVEKAFRRLDELKPNIYWWSSGDQLQKGMSSGEIALAAAWSGRVRSSHADLCGTNVECVLQINEKTALIATDWWIIPKGAKDSQAADRLLQAMYADPNAPKWAAAFAEKQGYAVPIAIDIKDPVARIYLRLNSSDTNILARISDTFWGNNYDWISSKWTEWRAR